MLSAPNIITKVTLGSTTFEIYAYRKLSKSECRFSVRYYMQQKHLKHVPENKTIKIITTIGSIQ